MDMLKLILGLLLLAVLLGAVGFTWVGSAVANIAWILLVVLVVLFIASFFFGRRRYV